MSQGELEVVIPQRETIPSLLDRASFALSSARSSGEVLEAKKIAELALHYAKVTRAANDAHADCLRVITRAEMRMADEVDRGQETGEIATQNHHPGSVRTLDTAPITAEELGIDRRRVSEWRDMRDAGPVAVETAITKALSEGRAPTKSEILAAAKEIKAERAEEKKERRQQKEADLGAKQASLPDKKYGVIYADPPWRFEPYSRETGMDRAADNHYPTMTFDDICALPVPAADDCVLFLWATVPMLPEALHVIKAWQFTYKSHLIWVKDRIGTGYWFRNQHELLLVATRGDIPAPSPDQRQPSVFHAMLGPHSEKPGDFAELIEILFPHLPKIEMFARSARLGWDAWGNEV